MTLVAGIVVPIVLEALKLCGVHVWAFLKTRKGPSKKFGLRKSALGQEQTGVGQAPMSALSLKADAFLKFDADGTAIITPLVLVTTTMFCFEE